MLLFKTVLSIYCFVNTVRLTISTPTNAPGTIDTSVTYNTSKPILTCGPRHPHTTPARHADPAYPTELGTKVFGNSTHSLPTNPPDSPAPASNWLVPFAASFNTLLIILSLLLNLIIITYHWGNSSNLSSTLYLRNGIADSISAIGFLVQVLLALWVLEDVPPSLALVSYWITTVTVRMSVFMNCVLGVVRCINILSPFYLVNRKCVTI